MTAIQYRNKVYNNCIDYFQYAVDIQEGICYLLLHEDVDGETIENLFPELNLFIQSEQNTLRGYIWALDEQGYNERFLALCFMVAMTE